MLLLHCTADGIFSSLPQKLFTVWCHILNSSHGFVQFYCKIHQRLNSSDKNQSWEQERDTILSLTLSVHQPDSWLVRPCNHESALLTLYPTLYRELRFASGLEAPARKLFPGCQMSDSGGKKRKNNQPKTFLLRQRGCCQLRYQMLKSCTHLFLTGKTVTSRRKQNKSRCGMKQVKGGGGHSKTLRTWII